MLVNPPVANGIESCDILELGTTFHSNPFILEKSMLDDLSDKQEDIAKRLERLRGYL